MTIVRRIRVGEADLYRRIRLASLQDAPYAFSSTYESALQRSRESWRGQADATAEGMDRATFIAFSDGVPVGIAALYRLEDPADKGEVVQVWVHPEHRGTNIARDLMDTILEWARENDFHTVVARITDGNARALNFYAKSGFSTDDATAPSGAEGIVMAKRVRC